ncbi:MAG TPA: hypothetical protein VGN82_14205 [Bosea sp. (in: a-proteobacteria)]|uniref:hypothetical protein n=1 Tax=Bosea sp. (in: a-proteobacteria) TaxID=1871050 RepID=UPI002E0D1404|nr:hypothetical protein [Bosea sp. (in: a-proteobacteria)]
MSLTLRLSPDASELDFVRPLTAAELIPEIGDAPVGLVETGDQLVTLDGDHLITAGTDEYRVRPNKSDRLWGLMAAARAGDSKLDILEHDRSQVAG